MKIKYIILFQLPLKFTNKDNYLLETTNFLMIMLKKNVIFIFSCNLKNI